MFSLIIQEKGGEQRRLVFDKPEITIGRVQGNDIVLPKGNVSKRHARIVLKDGKFIIVDLKSTNGTYVNGRKITSPLVVKESDKIYIGDFIMGVEEGASESAPEPPMPPSAPPRFDPPPAPHAPPPPPHSGGQSPELLRAALSRQEPPRPPMPPPAPSGGMSMAAPEPPRPPPPMAAPPPMAPEPRTRPPRPAPGTLPPPMSAAAPAVAREPAPAPVAPPAPTPVPAPMSSPAPAATPRPRLVGAGARRIAPRPVPPSLRRGVHLEPLDPKVIKLLDLQTSILERLRAKLDLDNIPVERLGDEDLWQKAERAIVDLVETLESSGELPKYIEQETLIKETLNEALGLGPLEDLLADDAVDEIIVDRRDRIVVGKDGALRGSGKAFSSDDVLRRVVERLVAPTGHVIDDASPLVDVRLRDGSRLVAAVSPVATQSACLVLRKPRGASHTLTGLVSAGSLSSAMGDFLMTCVAARRNVLVCGGAGSGQIQVVAALAQAAPEGERVVTVEDLSEIALKREEWVALETRPGDRRGGEIDLGTLVKAALRLRPDRLVVAEVRGAESLELAAALGSAIDGAVVAVAGEGAQAALGRLAALARLAAPDAADAVREVVASAFDVVVHVQRYADGVPRVVAVEEVLGTRDGGFETQPLFQYRGADGFASAGIVPRFYADLDARGVTADPAIFKG
jgi:pilus assembly protein CpaF